LTSSVLAPAIVPLACRTMDCSPTTLIRQAILPAIMASLPALAIMLTVWSLLGPGIVRLTVGAISGFGAALAVASIQVGPRRGLAFIRASIGRSQESEWREVEKNALAG
jgi:hypothetical protein